MPDTLELDGDKGVPIYVIVEKLLAIGQTEKVITMSTQEGNIAVYNTTKGDIVYTGYIDIAKGEFITPDVNDEE